MFTKLFSSITDSTIWRESDHVRIVWITMLAKADVSGFVWSSIPGLADAARVNLDQCLEALAKLMSPDEWSRSKENEGRRIEEVDGGWRLLNYDKYRKIRNMEERREYVRKKVAEHRQNVNNVNKSKQCKQMLTHAEGEEEVEEKKKEESLSVVIPKSLSTADFTVLWNEWVSFRMTLKKSKNWNAFFTKQLAELEKWGLQAATESIKQSLLNEYQGLFFPKNMKIKDYSISKPASIEDHLKAQGVK